MHLQISRARLFFIDGVIELTTGGTIKGEEGQQDAVRVCRWPSRGGGGEPLIIMKFMGEKKKKTTEREALRRF